MGFPFELPILFDGAADNDLTAYGMPPGAHMENWILEHPGAFENLLRDYINAGARMVCAPTFSANRACLAEFGLEDSVVSLNTGLIELAKNIAKPFKIPIGGLLSPTGLFVSPFGESGFDDIYSVYREQICALNNAGADFILLDRQDSLADMRAAMLAARTIDLPVFVVVSVDSSGHTLTGGGFLPALITLQAMGADAVGIHSFLSAGVLPETVKKVFPHAAVPLIAMPDADAGESPAQFAENMRPVIEAGVRIAGGGDGVSLEYLSALAETIKEYGPPDIPKEPDCYAAAIESEAFFLGDDIVFSEPISCTSSLEDDLIDLDDEQVSAALVTVTDMDDAMILGQSSYMTKLPIAVHAENAIVLDAALRYFQGRLIIDSNCRLETEILEPLAAKYGAIIY